MSGFWLHNLEASLGIQITQPEKIQQHLQGQMTIPLIVSAAILSGHIDDKMLDDLRGHDRSKVEDKAMGRLAADIQANRVEVV